MSSIATFLSRTPSSLPSFSKPNQSPSSSTFLFLSTKKRRPPSLRPPPPSPRAAAATSGTQKPSIGSDERVQRVQQVHTIDEFDAALRSAENKLVVVEYAASHSPNSRRIYPCMVELSRTCDDIDFLLVMGDESDETRELCRREGIDKVPHFSFYKGMEKVHEEEGIGPDQLVGDVLYYGDNHAGVVQLRCRKDVEALIDEHRGAEGKLVVLDVGLKHCGPCVKVYPTVIKLSRSMADAVMFARMNGDENDSCMEFLKDMGVVEVPTFLFLRDGKICGRYVGSGKGELIGEILRYQGVTVTLKFFWGTKTVRRYSCPLISCIEDLWKACCCRGLSGSVRRGGSTPCRRDRCSALGRPEKKKSARVGRWHRRGILRRSSQLGGLGTVGRRERKMRRERERKRCPFPVFSLCPTLFDQDFFL